ncbi:hypothetical protein NDU88_003225 [Pleurodeles waltl]|uniref:Gypsy retrotransposon integrase-like protein 1 n=1 Tax=Pleurodeles waltl TaxID=8319 RepID=A0AAV7W4P9_PLEWA|nr:hypothetical protein NDU88_003225 [Pleurodeles waltl]
MSRKLNKAEHNYVIAEKELLAIRDTFKEWKHQLLGAKYTVTVYTDHRNLQFMSSARLLTPRQLRQMLFFAEFDFVVTFHPGKDNRKADALTHKQSTTLPTVQPSRAIIAPNKVLCITKTEDFFEDIRNSFTIEKWQAWAQADPKRSIKHGLSFHDARLYVPTTKLRKLVFHWMHVIPKAGHPGTPKTLELIQRYFWWPTVTKDVKTMVNNCEVCARIKTSHTKPKRLLHPLPTRCRPWEHISLDFITGLPVVQQHSVILVVDSLTKYGHFIACKKLPTSSELATDPVFKGIRVLGPSFHIERFFLVRVNVPEGSGIYMLIFESARCTIHSWHLTFEIRVGNSVRDHFLDICILTFESARRAIHSLHLILDTHCALPFLGICMVASESARREILSLHLILDTHCALQFLAICKVAFESARRAIHSLHLTLDNHCARPFLSICIVAFKSARRAIHS